MLCCFGLVALGALLLPALALSAPLTQITPSFVGGSPGAGTSLRLQVRVAFNPEPEKLAAVVHLPKGTSPLITMPGICPRGGFAWRTDLPFERGPQTTFPTTSPCPPGSKAATATLQPIATATQAPATQFQCEKAYHSAAGRQRCFDQLPGASCAHPLEAEKAGDTTRGQSRYFKLGFHEEVRSEGGPQGGAEQHYSYAPRANVRMCPYPIGAVYKVSLLSEEGICTRNVKGEKECSVEYDTHNHPEPVGPHGGSFSYYMTSVPLKSWYLAIKGYYIHPPWE